MEHTKRISKTIRIDKHMCKSVMFLSILFFFSQAQSQPPPSWQYTNTGENHTIVIQVSTNPSVNGTALDTGTYIGVFFDAGDSLKCAGYIKWRGISTSLAAWGNDGSNPPLGLALDEEFKFKVWLHDSCTIDNVKVTYLMGSPFTNKGTYANNGISGLASLEGNGCLTSTILDYGIMINKFKIYPNPFHSSIYLEFHSFKTTTAQIKLSDIYGRVIYSTKKQLHLGDNRWKVEPDYELLNGLYFLELKVEGKSINIKLIKVTD